MSRILLLNANIREAREDLAELKDIKTEMLECAQKAKSFSEWLRWRNDARWAQRDIAKASRQVAFLENELERARYGEPEFEL